MKKSPKCLHVFPSLPRVNAYPLQEFKIRVIQYPNSPKLLDIREFITAPNYQGYGWKGISLTKEQVDFLFSIQSPVMEVMKNETVPTPNPVAKEQGSNEVRTTDGIEILGKDIPNEESST